MQVVCFSPQAEGGSPMKAMKAKAEGESPTKAMKAMKAKAEGESPSKSVKAKAEQASPTKAMKTKKPSRDDDDRGRKNSFFRLEPVRTRPNPSELVRTRLEPIRICPKTPPEKVQGLAINTTE